MNFSLILLAFVRTSHIEVGLIQLNLSCIEKNTNLVGGGYRMNAEAFAREFMSVFDTQDAEKIVAYLHEDVRMQLANWPIFTGIEQVKAAFSSAAVRFADLHHNILGVFEGKWEEGNVICIETLVTYDIKGGSSITLPVTTIMRLRGEKIADYRIYMDPNPVFS